GRTVVLVNPAADLFAGYLVIKRAAEGQPLGPLRWLATGTTPVTVTRVDARTLRVRPERGFFPYVSEQMLRSTAHGFARGETVQLTGLGVEVTEVLGDGRPAEILAHFDRSLEDPTYYWASWKGGGFQPFSPPPIGASVTLPSTNFLE